MFIISCSLSSYLHHNLLVQPWMYRYKPHHPYEHSLGNIPSRFLCTIFWGHIVMFERVTLWGQPVLFPRLNSWLSTRLCLSCMINSSEVFVVRDISLQLKLSSGFQSHQIQIFKDKSQWKRSDQACSTPWGLCSHKTFTVLCCFLGWWNKRKFSHVVGQVMYMLL